MYPTAGPWRVEPHAEGGAHLIAPDNTSVGYVEHAEDAQLIVEYQRVYEEHRAQQEHEAAALIEHAGLG